MPSGKRVMRRIDRCIAPIVSMLNSYGIPTLASCCGHKSRFGNVAVDPHRVNITFDPDGKIIISLETTRQDVKA